MNGIETEIQFTADGSATLYRPDMDEHYHSVKGAITESRHVYVESGLLHKASEMSGGMLRVLEVGFGTGLNAALTAQCDIPGCAVHYISIEMYPLDAAVVSAMDLGCDRKILEAVTYAPWGEDVAVTPAFTLHKVQADFTQCALPENVDVVYFDAFAPEKQPEMWTRQGFERLYAAMGHGGIFVTYCAKGSVRRMMQDIGFVAERIPGPPGGKREILRCTKP